MRAWLGVCVLVAVSACYRGASELPACSLRCEQGCPSGMTCSNGYCTKGGTCAVETDAGPTCGELGQACCGGIPACTGNGMCVADVCQPGCITDLTFGRRYGCALLHDNTLWCTGDNQDGELANGTLGGSATSTFAPATDANGPIADATNVSGGAFHACAVRASGHVWCWGYNGYGELGNNTTNGSSTAVEVLMTSLEPLANMVEVVSGTYSSCARDAMGSVYCWGHNSHGQLGDGTINDRGTAAPVLTNGAGTAALTNTKQLVLDRDVACVIDSSDHLLCWGRNDTDNLGTGNETDSLIPLHTLDATAVALTGYGGCALLPDTTVKCWGGGWQGRIGDGNAGGAATARQVLAEDGTPLTGVIGIAGGGVACAVMADHHAMCWGNNPHGQTGNGAGSLFPSPVTGGDNVAKLTARFAHICATGLDGDVRCWGRNTEGELGNDTFDNVPAPEPIASICR